MADWGIKVSKVGQNVKTASDLNMQFSSKFSTLKILGKGDTTLTTDGSGNGSVTITHNLGYAPAYYVWLKGTASFSFLDGSTYSNSFVPITTAGSNWISDANKISAYTTSTTLVITASGATPSTTYTLRYYYLVDLAQTYSSSAGISLSNAYGMKVSKTGYDVKTAQEYRMGYSQKYKSLQYYDVNYQTQSLSLPLMYADPLAQTVEAGTYVDINHGLGYQPFFLAWALNFPLVPGLTNQNIFCPQVAGRANGALSQSGSAIIEGFCDSTKIRLSFYEKSVATANNVNGPKYPATTITFKCIIFTENLTT